MWPLPSLVRAYADMYYRCDIIGAVDCSKLYEPNVWLTAMMKESEAPQPFCSASFKAWADSILRRDINISQESITTACCREVYLHLVNEDPRE